MAMQTNLSKKDKMTIAIVLFAALVFVSIWYLIRPNITSIMTISDKIEQAELTQNQYNNKLINLSSGEAIYEKTVSDFKESTAYLYPLMDSSEIDRMVTSYVLKSNLFSENLSIRMPTDSVEEKPYRYSSIKVRTDNSVVETPIDTSLSENETEDVTSDTSSEAKTTTVDSLLTPYENTRYNCSSTKSSGVRCVSLTLVVTGTRKACQAMIDDLCTKDALRITGFEWSEVDYIEKVNPETGAVELVDSGKVRLKISINLYMADIADYDTPAGTEE